MVDFAVDEEVEGSPDDGEVVVDADERVVDAFLDVGGSGLADALGEGFEGHLGGLAVAHQDHGSAGERGLLDGGSVTLGHAVEERLDGGEDGLLFGGCGVECWGEQGGGDGCGGEGQEVGAERWLHGF